MQGFGPRGPTSCLFNAIDVQDEQVAGDAAVPHLHFHELMQNGHRLARRQVPGSALLAFELPIGMEVVDMPSMKAA